MASDEFEKFAADHPSESQEAGGLILCDINGTIVLENGQINTFLVSFLIVARNMGFEVQLFSDDPSGSTKTMETLRNAQAMRGDYDLHELMYPGDGFPINLDDPEIIKSKSDFNGVKALFVFDDDHSTHNVDSEYKLPPNYEHLLALIGMKGFVGKTAHEATDSRFPKPVNNKPF